MPQKFLQFRCPNFQKKLSINGKNGAKIPIKTINNHHSCNSNPHPFFNRK